MHARKALHRAHVQHCNLEDAEEVSAHCVPWLVNPTSLLPRVPWDGKQVCRLVAAYIVGAGAICADTQLNGQNVAFTALLHAINLPVTLLVRDKVEALGRLGPVAARAVAACAAAQTCARRSAPGQAHHIMNQPPLWGRRG